MKRTHLSSAIGLVLGLAFVAPMHAQQASTDASTKPTAAKQAEAKQLESVTVSARRRNESMEKVPVAVSAFSGDDMKDLQANSIDGLQGAVPNMNIVQGRGSSSAANIFIRGIGQPDALQTFDPGVGMYVDDVYYSRIQGALISLFDVERVEVLRGPQGTLYGKNSTGGAIKVSTKNPFDHEGGAAELTVGDYGRREGSFYYSGKFSETFAASIAGAKIVNDGYVENRAGGHNFNDDDTEALRVKLAFKPSDAFSATLALDHTKQDAALTMGRPMAPLLQTSIVPAGVTVLQPGETGDWDRSAETSFSAT